ncbi:MAG: ABC transporter ATP-binding protein [Deltaproteobacteria bacterium]|nr:MAG: ABC transporter ATP-binding protein [Pseudomonadota bacterium]PIE66247.1 MAG: ABC transporter ATP-binding protein [Deltaproteobacteria bacterium]
MSERPERGLRCRELTLKRPRPGGGERLILDAVDAHFVAGELSLVTGPIGSGKTTLLHLLAALLRPTAGEVLADDEAVSRYAAAHRDRWRGRVGLAFQSPTFLDELPVLQNVMVPLLPQADSLAAARRRAEEELARFGVAKLAGRQLAGLSGGERQRVTLARALCGEPRFVLVDEPTAHQDQEGAELVLGRLRELAAQDATVVCVSHDLRLRDGDVADRRWEISEGKLVSATSREEVPEPTHAEGDTL